MTVHDHARQRTIKLTRLKLALILTASGMIVEFIGGLLSNSLALISDAGHMLTHLLALGMTYLAMLLSLRPATKERTYGFHRAEILAAFVNAVLLIVIAAYLVYEAIVRAFAPQQIKVGEMLLVAAVGLLVNGISTALLAKISVGDMNIKSAFVHEISDMISSIAVVAAAIVMFYTGNYIVDPLLSLLICVLIVIWAAKLLFDSANILLESTPRHLDIDELKRAIESEIKEVHEVHHIHAWTIASSMYALTAHVVIEDCRISAANEVLLKINDLVRERFHIGHTNIQFECRAKHDGAQ